MTTRRLIASLTVSSAALALAAIVAVRSFPLEAQGTVGFAQESGDSPIQIVKGGDHLLHASFSEYPRRAIEQQVQGDVVLDLVTDDRGEVSDARVLSGPEELRRAALESVLQWHYSPEAMRSTSLQTTLRFSLPAADSEREARAHNLPAKHEDDEKANDSPAARAEHVMKELSEALQDPSASDQQKDEWKRSYAEKATLLEKIRADLADGRESVYTIRTAPGRPLFEGSPRLVQIRGERVTPATMNELTRRAGIHVGDQISEETAKRIRDVATSLDEHLRVSFRGDGKGGVIVMVLNP